MKHIMISATIHAIVCATASAQARFDNGFKVGQPTKGFINLRTNLNGVPNSPNEGTDRMVVAAVGPTDTWTVRINQDDHGDGRLLFVGSTAHTQQGTGGPIDITFTSIAKGLGHVTIDITTSEGTSTISTVVNAFVLRPQYAAQFHGNPCVFFFEGQAGEARGEVRRDVSTRATPSRGNTPDFTFVDVGRACNIRGSVRSRGNFRRSTVEFQLQSRFRLVSDPVTLELFGEIGKVQFSALQRFFRENVRVHCDVATGEAEWDFRIVQTTDAPGISPDPVETQSVLAFCSSPVIGGPVVPDANLPDGFFQRGVTNPDLLTSPCPDLHHSGCLTA